MEMYYGHAEFEKQHFRKASKYIRHRREWACTVLVGAGAEVCPPQVA